MGCGEPDYCFWDLVYEGRLQSSEILVFSLSAHQLPLFCDDHFAFLNFFCDLVTLRVEHQSGVGDAVGSFALFRPFSIV